MKSKSVSPKEIKARAAEKNIEIRREKSKTVVVYLYSGKEYYHNSPLYVVANKLGLLSIEEFQLMSGNGTDSRYWNH